MTLGERINLIIKERGMKKVEFAESVKINQSYVTKIIKGTCNISPRLMDSICKTYGVNQKWLETGEGEMYVSKPTQMMNDLEEMYSLPPQSRRFVENFLSLPPTVRDMIATAIEKAVALYPRQPHEPPKCASELTPEEKLAIVTEEIQAEAAARKRGLVSSASTLSYGLGNKNRI